MQNVQTKIEFDKNKSTRAKEIEALTNDQLFARYFKPCNLKAEDKERSYYDDLSKEIASFPHVWSLIGDRLNAIATKFYASVIAYTPSNYNLNASKVFADIEAMMAENQAYAFQATQNPILTPFMKQMCAFMVEKLVNSLTNKLNFNL